MHARLILGIGCFALVCTLAWYTTVESEPPENTRWEKIADGIYRTRSMPHSYAVMERTSALLIDATAPPESLVELGVRSVESVLLTHHHRDTAEFASAYRQKRMKVRAPTDSAAWLLPEKVAKFWKDSIPLRNSRTAYFVLPEGIAGIDCTIKDGDSFDFGRWRITAVATPGHSSDHFAYHCTLAAKSNEPGHLFCGDAFCATGKMWTPYTTDWDHWTDAGLKPTATSLRKLAKLNPAQLCPVHGPILEKDVAKALEVTAKAVDEAAFMKSFERYSKERLGDAPKYAFLVPKEQIASGGDKPWAKVCEGLWITGNTYVLKSRNGDGILVLDPWGQRSADQVERLRKDEKLGAIEVVIFSHAHYDHFDGIYVLNGRDKCEVWALDRVAGPLKEPNRIRAPFLDPRPIKFTKELQDGETATWGGYSFRFHHLPGQSWFTCGIETTIAGKRCVFTADNFFHQDQFSGSGGWMGLNRSSPVVYGTSARKVLEIAPEWILAEHGGPYVFDIEDYRRRVKWGEAAGNAANALCLSGDHLRDWTPHRVTVEPVLQVAKPGDELSVRVTLSELNRPDPGMVVTLRGRGMFADSRVEFPPGGQQSRDVKLKLAHSITPGRHVFWVHTAESHRAEPVDAYFAVDVSAPR